MFVFVMLKQVNLHAEKKKENKEQYTEANCAV